MAWNGSEAASSAAVNKSAAKSKKQTAANVSPSSGVLKAIVAFFVVAILGGLAYIYLANEDMRLKVSEKFRKVQQIEEVEADIAIKEDEPQEEKVVPQIVTNRHGVVAEKKVVPTYVDSRGVQRYVEGNGRVPLADASKYLVESITFSSGLPEFKHEVENEIATLLTIESGDMLFGDAVYNQHYKNDFVKSLMEPIEITDDDSEEDKRIKQMVEQTKHDLAQRIKDGEDLGEILQAERDEIRRMANYKTQMSDLFHEALNDGTIQTVDDVDMYVEAMNKMLESKGIEPIKMTGLMRRKIGYDLAKEKESVKEANE